MTRFLRFADQAAFNAACETAGYWITEPPGRPLLLSHAHIFDVLGPLAQVTKTLLDGDSPEAFAAFMVALSDDHTGWVFQFDAPDLKEPKAIKLRVDFGNQLTGDHDSKTIEITPVEGGGYTVEQLIFDEDGNETGRETPTNTTDNPGATFDAWHVNAKLQGLPAGWDAYVVTPGSPVRVFAGD